MRTWSVAEVVSFLKSNDFPRLSLKATFPTCFGFSGSMRFIGEKCERVKRRLSSANLCTCTSRIRSLLTAACGVVSANKQRLVPFPLLFVSSIAFAFVWFPAMLCVWLWQPHHLS